MPEVANEGNSSSRRRRPPPAENQLVLPLHIKIARLLERRLGIGFNEKHLLRVFVLRAEGKPEREIFMRQEAIADAMEVSTKTAARAAKGLEKLALIIPVEKYKWRLSRAGLWEIAGVLQDDSTGQIVRQFVPTEGQIVRAPGQIVGQFVESGEPSPLSRKEGKEEGDPPPTCCANWEQIESKLRSFGMDQAPAAIATLERNGLSPIDALRLIEHAERNQGNCYSLAGAVYTRIQTARPGMSPREFWPWAGEQASDRPSSDSACASPIYQEIDDEQS